MANQNEKIEILLVDDRPENLVALEAVLFSPEYQLIKANSGDEALRYLLDHDPALILMDVQMPDLDGFETASIIKKSDRSREIPIIFITAINKDERYVQKGYAGGAVDYVYKPFDPQILKSKVAVFADLYRKTQRLLSYERALRENERRERERRLYELELKSLRREQAEQKKYRDLVDGLNHGIVWAADSKSLQFSFVSSSAQKILGYPTEQWMSEAGFWMDHIPEVDRKKVEEALQKILSDRQDVSLEHRFIKMTGETIWLHTGIRIARDTDELHYEFRGLSIDITEIKNAQEIERRSKENANFLAQASLVLSESLDMQTTINRIGQVALPKLADWYAIDVLQDDNQIQSLALVHHESEKTELGKILRDQFPKDRNSPYGIANVLRSVLKTGKAELISDLENRFLAEGFEDPKAKEVLKELKLKSAIIVPLSARGRVFGAFSMISAESGHHYDEADLLVAEGLGVRIAAAIDSATLYKQAQSAIRARDEFLSIASHELKTPLTPLKLHIQGLLRTLNGGSLADLKPEKVTKMLHSSDRQINRLSQLVENLLDISRITIGKLSLEPSMFDLGELVRDVVDRFSMQIDSSKCELKLVLQDGVTVYADRFRLEQVIVNLLTNSLKYGMNKPVEIKLSSDDAKVSLSFSDQGIGIAKEDQGRIFERFERAVSSNDIAGLGLGLYIVTQILKAHHGLIHVESEPGCGSTFMVDLPVPTKATAEVEGSSLKYIGPNEAQASQDLVLPRLLH